MARCCVYLWVPASISKATSSITNQVVFIREETGILFIWKTIKGWFLCMPSNFFLSSSSVSDVLGLPRGRLRWVWLCKKFSPFRTLHCPMYSNVGPITEPRRITLSYNYCSTYSIRWCTAPLFSYGCVMCIYSKMSILVSSLIDTFIKNDPHLL